MLFLFRGHNGPVVRAVIGVVLVVVGIAVHGGAILIGVGAVLLLWAGVLALRVHRVSRQARVSDGGRMS